MRGLSGRDFQGKPGQYLTGSYGMKSRLAVMVVVVTGWLAGGGWLGGKAVGQFQAYGTDQVSAYTGGWGSRFGVVGGPIVTVNGYLYPFYSPFDLNRIDPSGFVNGGPVYSDWRTGYDRLDPARLYQGRLLGLGTGGWGGRDSRLLCCRWWRARRSPRWGSMRREVRGSLARVRSRFRNNHHG